MFPLILTAVISSFLLIAKHFSRLSFALAAAFYRIRKYKNSSSTVHVGQQILHKATES